MPERAASDEPIPQLTMAERPGLPPLSWLRARSSTTARMATPRWAMASFSSSLTVPNVWPSCGT